MMSGCYAWGMVLGAALCTWACGSDPTGVTEGGGAGAAARPTGGAGGDSGEGARSGSASCWEADDCKSFGDCSTLEELEADCNTVERWMYRSTCGGTYVEDRGGVTESVWLFDATGSPIGASYEGEGSCSSWGEPCGRLGAGAPLCDAQAGGGAG
jgi:hypothetical protein